MDIPLLFTVRLVKYLNCLELKITIHGISCTFVSACCVQMLTPCSFLRIKFKNMILVWNIKNILLSLSYQSGFCIFHL